MPEFRHIPRLVMLAALPVGLSCPAAAQSQQAPVLLSPVTVTGKAETSPTLPDTEEARRLIEQTPGAVEVIPDSRWRDTAASTLKDALEYTPGVFVQPKWGEDSRLSIRGSGLSRNFHLRGIQLYQDGVPTTNSDGGSDFQELDPTAFRYLEVYKGANALRYGANSLGGAFNFVSPSGRDALHFEGRADVGSFGFRRLQASSGGTSDNIDGYITGSWLRQDGFRDHSGGESYRASGNVGWRFADGSETRFFVAAADINQDIPGSLTKAAALSSPTTAAAGNLRLNYQRNIESARVSNKTTLVFDETTAEFGGFAANKHLIHPIFQYLDYDYYDFGLYGRAIHENELGGYGNRLTLGATLTGGWVDNSQFVNLAGGNRGALVSRSTDRSTNAVLYAENALEVLPGIEIIPAVQFVHATRERDDEFPAAPNTSGTNDYTFINPKLGLLWQMDSRWQVFANLSRSAEAPTFSELNFTNATLADTRAQRATTLELGTRGATDTFTWDVAIYRAELRNEFQFFDLGGGNFQVTNADDTVHQGLEAGFGWAFASSLWESGSNPDRLWLNAAYTFNDFFFDDDPSWGDNELPGAPRHFIRSELVYRHPSGFYAGPNLE